MTALLQQPQPLSLLEKRILLKIIDDHCWVGEGYFPRDDGKLYVPNPGQALFHESKARFKGLIGGRGSGKTVGGAQEALKRIRKGLPGAVYNPDFENFKDSTWPEFKKWIPWHRVIPEDRRMGEHGWEPWRPFTLHFDNGASVKCKGLKEPDSARGPNINWLWYDEGGRDKTGLAWKLAIASVRIGPDPSAFVTTTPKGVRHWIYDNFVQGEVPEEAKKILDAAGYKGKLYDWFSASIHDNAENLDPIFYASLLSQYTGRFALQELGGKFVEIAEGLVYDDFSIEIFPDGNLTEDEPDPTMPIEIGVDDGYVDPRATLFIQRTGRDILIFDELYHSHHLEETCISEIIDRCKAWPWEQDEEKRKKIVEGDQRLIPEIGIISHEATQLRRRFREADIPARSRNHKIVEGIKVVRRLILDGNGVRSLRVHKRCSNLIAEITQGYRYPDEQAKKNNENPEDGNDHTCDAFRMWAFVRAR